MYSTSFPSQNIWYYNTVFVSNDFSITKYLYGSVQTLAALRLGKERSWSFFNTENDLTCLQW